MASSRMSTMFYLACTIIFTLFMIDSAGCSSAPSNKLNPAPNQIPRDFEGSSSLAIMETPSSAFPSVPLASEYLLAITKTDDVTVTQPPITVTSTQPPSTVTISVSQIANFTSYKAINTTSQIQSLATGTGMSSQTGTNTLTNSTTLAVATATPPAPSNPAVTTTNKSPGNLSAHNPIAQLVEHLKTLVPDRNPKKRAVEASRNHGLVLWTGVISISLVFYIAAPQMLTAYKLECRFR